MIKGAQRKSMDPVQQRLRQSKSTWNKEVSAFINDLIHLKKLMNGWPSKFYKERSRITEPMPADPATILGSLAGDFQEIAQRGNALVQQQIQYSQNRRKPQPKQMNLPLPEPTAPATPAAEPPKPPQDLSKQLSLGLTAAKFEEKYGLVAEGSNPLTRFLTRMTTPRAGFGQKAQTRRLRMDMLNFSVKTYRALGRLQVDVSKSSKKSVQDAYKDMQAAWNEWANVSRNFNQYASTLPEGSPVKIPDMTEEGYSPDKEEREDAEAAKPWAGFAISNQIINDYRAFGQLFDQEDEGQLAELGNIIAKISKVPKVQKAGFAQLLAERYQKAIDSINRNLGTQGSSLREIYQQLDKQRKQEEKDKKKITPSQIPLKGSQPPVPPEQPPLVNEASANAQLEVVAQAFLQKWLGKLRHQGLPGKSSGVRIQIFELATSARKNVNQAMDVLEKGLDVQSLGPIVATVTQQMNTLRSLMRALHNIEKPPPGKGGKGSGALEGFF
jgi:hypothetical protein